MIFGGLDDQISLLLWAKVSSIPFKINEIDLISGSIYLEVFQSYLRPWLSDQPVLWFFISFFASILKDNFYNVFLITSVIASFLSSLLLFKRFKFQIPLSLVFTFSSYMWIHLGKHPALMMIWLFPLTLHLIEQVTKTKYALKSVIKASAFIGLSLLISQYYGYFLLILFSLWILIDVISKEISIKSFIKNYFILFTTVIVVTGLFLAPYIKANYFQSSEESRHTSSRQLQRPLEDFITFSYRPWYSFIPSVKSPIYRDISTEAISSLKDTGYFLADDYFQGEHDGHFFGYAFYLVFITVTITYIFQVKKKIIFPNNPYLIKYLILVTALLILSLPPFITISGITVYMPSYLLFKLFPMFRSLTRLSVLELLLMLMSLGYMLEVIRIKSSRMLKIFTLLVVLIIIAETYVPLKIYRIPPTPSIYMYMGENLNKTKFLVYPYSKTQEALFYLPYHKQELLNIRYYSSNIYSSEELTKILNTDLGLEESKKIGSEYLVVFKDISKDDLNFFMSSNVIKYVMEFEDAYLFSY